jgi:hypothetical protein
MMLFIPVALGIGRSGNGTTIESKSGFEVKVPEFFEEFQPLAGERLRLVSFIREFRAGMISQPFLEFSNLGQSLPAFANLERSEIPAALEKLGWQKAEHPDPCVDAYMQTTSSTQVLATFWGKGAGLVVVGPNSPNVKVALDSVRETLQLKEKACAW